MPKYIPRKEEETLRKWECPGCGVEFEAVAKGDEVTFLYKDKKFGGCGGTWEKVMVECPNCKGYIEFTREELLGG